jgi:hypothetical protein
MNWQKTFALLSRSTADDCRFRHLAIDRSVNRWTKRFVGADFWRGSNTGSGSEGLLRAHAVLPGWLKVQYVRDGAKVQAYAQKVDLGEAEAIALAEELHADYLLMDERKGRRLAQARHLQVVGLLGVILIAKRRGLIPSARDLLSQLDEKAGVYLSNDLKSTALKSVGE